MNILIVSLKFRVAHVAHLVASYRQMEELGHSPQLFIHPDMVKFLPFGIGYTTEFKGINPPTIAFFWFPALGNVKMMKRLKHKFGSRIAYVLHEPLEKISAYCESGLSLTQIGSIYLKYLFQLFIISSSDAVILPSEKALKLYGGSRVRKLCPNYTMIPLLFDDHANNTTNERKYFSYIGTIAQDHAYNEFVNFIVKAAEDNSIQNKIKFLIATKNRVEITPNLNRLIESGMLKVVQGHPLTEEEINRYYKSSICVWNAYHRTTQSGVLAKASIFGTPAIIMSKNESEFAIDKFNVIAIHDNSDYMEIKVSLDTIINNFDEFSKNARTMFEQNFYYKAHNDKITRLINHLA